MTVRTDGALKFDSQRQGFTVVELLVVIAILITLALVAVPNFSSWASKQRVKGVARDLVSHFQYARLEAVKRSTTIAFMFNTDEDLGPDGYRVFVDDGGGEEDKAGNLTQDNNDEVTLIDLHIPEGVTLASTTFVDNEVGYNAFGYNARGFPVAASFSGSEGKVTVSDLSDTITYELVLQKTSGLLELKGPL